MYCSHCGQPLDGTTCRACGRSTEPHPVRASSRLLAIAVSGLILAAVSGLIVAGLIAAGLRINRNRPGPSPETSAPASDIRRIDFRNFTFTPECADKMPVVTTAGGFERDRRDDYLRFTVDDIVHGDLTADGIDEAVVLTTCNTGGSGVFSEAFIYAFDGRAAKPLTSLAGGDRALGGIHRASIDRGLLALERYGDDGGGACCPDFLEVTRYRWAEGQLVRQDMPRRMLLLPQGIAAQPEPVVFAPGETSKIVSETTIGSRLFAIKAPPGQSLRVRQRQGDDRFVVSAGTADRGYVGRIGPVAEQLEWPLQQTGDLLLLVRGPGQGVPTTFSVELTILPAGTIGTFPTAEAGSAPGAGKRD